MDSNIVQFQVKSYQGRAIRIRETDRYVCLTDMATASGKLFADWHQNKSTALYLEALSPVMGIPISELIEVIKGGNPDEQGTWAHPKVAIKFAAWCSPQFEVQVTIWIDELMTTGSVSIAPQRELSRLELLQIGLEAEQGRLAAESKANQLAAQIETDREATELGKAIAKAPNNIRIGDFAKSIGMGQNRYFDELRDCGIIQQTSNTPYQRYLDAKYFVVTQIIAANGKTYPVSLITPKGQAYLVKRHNKYISRETVRDAIECQVVAIV